MAKEDTPRVRAAKKYANRTDQSGVTSRQEKCIAIAAFLAGVRYQSAAQKGGMT
jgi:hypothetical protein